MVSAHEQRRPSIEVGIGACLVLGYLIARFCFAFVGVDGLYSSILHKYMESRSLLVSWSWRVPEVCCCPMRINPDQVKWC